MMMVEVAAIKTKALVWEVNDTDGNKDNYFLKCCWFLLWQNLDDKTDNLIKFSVCYIYRD